MLLLRKRLGGHDAYHRYRTADEVLLVISGGADVFAPVRHMPRVSSVLRALGVQDEVNAEPVEGELVTAEPVTAEVVRVQGSSRPGWSAHQNIDMCGQGDIEVIHNWRGKHVIEELMRKVEQNGYSAVCVGSFGHAALKKFPYQLTAGHCKPSSGYTNTLYIWSGGGSGKAVPAVEETGTVVEAGCEPPPLHDIVDALKRNLGLDGTWPEVVDAACLQLGVAPTGSLQEKGDACWRAMEG